MAKRLINAIFSGNTELVRKLIKKTNINATHNGSTALTVAAHEGHTEIVRLLLEKKKSQKSSKKPPNS